MVDTYQQRHTATCYSASTGQDCVAQLLMGMRNHVTRLQWNSTFEEAFMCAVRGGHLDAVKAICYAESSSIPYIPLDETALCLAAAHGHVDIISWLDDILDDEGCLYEALLAAASAGQLHACECILARGPICQYGSTGRIAESTIDARSQMTFAAAYARTPEIRRLLVDAYGEPPHVPDDVQSRFKLCDLSEL